MANNWNLGLVGHLDGTKSKNQLNQDIQALKKVLNDVELKAKLDPNQVKALEAQLNNLQVRLTDVTFTQSALDGLVNQINDALKGIQIPNINISPGVISNAGKVISDELEKALEQVTSPELEVGFHVDATDSGKFEKEVSQIITELQKQDATAISYRLNTYIEVDKDSGERIEHLKNATFQFTTATGESIRKTIEFNEALKTWGESSATYSKALGTMSEKTDNFIQKRKQAVANFEIDLKNIQSRVDDKGTSKPIKDQDHITELEKQYKNVNTAIQNLNSSTVDTFTDMKIAVQKAIAELENLERQYRNAETIATSLRSKDFDTTKGIQQENLTDFIEKVKNSKVSTDEFNAGLSELHKNLGSTFKVDSLDGLQTFLDGITQNNVSELVEFLNMLDLAKAKLKSLNSEKTTENTSAKISADADKLKSTIESFKSANPAIETWTHNIDDAEFSIAELLNRLEQVGSSDDVRVIAKQFDAFKEAAEKAGVATKSTVSEYETLLKKANEAISTNRYKGSTSKVTKSYEKLDGSLVNKDLKNDYEELISLSKSFNSSMADDEKVNAYKKLETLLSSVKNRITELSSEQEKLDKVSEIKGLSAEGKFTSQVSDITTDYNRLSAVTDELKNDFKELNTLKDTLNTSTDADVLRESYEKFNTTLQKVKNSISVLDDQGMMYASQKKIDSLAESVLKFRNNNSKMSKDLKNEFTKLYNTLTNGTKLTDAEVDELTTSFANLKLQIREAGQLGQSFGDKLKNAFKKFGEWGFATGVASKLLQTGRDMVDNIYEIDTAMTNLYKVTDETAERYDQFLTSSTAKAKELGRTVSSFIEQTANWTKLGYSLDDAEILAEISSIYANVGEVDDDTAVSDMVTAMKAFNIEASDAITIVDKLNTLGNKYATSAADLGSGLSKSASALVTAGTSIDKTLAMLTGGAEITQSADEFGNMLKVGSMRIRGMKGELEELGEEVDENVESISKMQTQILNLTHGNVNIFDDNGDFKDYYEIMEGISDIYNDLSSTEQASLLEILFGKQRGNQGAALIQAFQSGQIQKAYQDIQESAGSAYEEQSRWLESLEAKTQQFEAAFQSLSRTIIDSDPIKWFVDLGTIGISKIDDLISGTTKLSSLTSIMFGAASGLVMNKSGIGKRTAFQW